MEFLKDLSQYFMQNKKYWLIPLFIVFLLFGFLMYLSGNTVIAPMIYTIF